MPDVRLLQASATARSTGRCPVSSIRFMAIALAPEEIGEINAHCGHLVGGFWAASAAARAQLAQSCPWGLTASWPLSTRWPFTPGGTAYPCWQSILKKRPMPLALSGP